MLQWTLGAAVLLALWIILTGGAVASLAIGLPAIVATLWLSRRQALGWSTPVDIVALVRFVPHFLWRSVVGAAQVARASLQPKGATQPSRFNFPTHLHGDPARTFFVYCANLMPGSLALSLRDTELIAHSLNAQEAETDLRDLERRIGRIFPASLAEETAT